MGKLDSSPSFFGGSILINYDRSRFKSQSSINLISVSVFSLHSQAVLPIILLFQRFSESIEGRHVEK